MQGCIFIDRDPKHFGLILNFLRDGFAVLPRDEQALREIMVEAAHYKVGILHTHQNTVLRVVPKGPEDTGGLRGS